LPTPTRSGYIFNGWFTAGTGGTAVTVNKVYSKDTTIYAQWIEKYRVLFSAQGGTVTPAFDSTGVDSTLSSLPTPTRIGYTFKGWFTTLTGGTEVTVDKKYTGNTSIFAQWIQEIPNPEKTPFTDSRDGKTYQKVTIGTQTWMAENLNYEAAGSRCYDDDETNCDTYGRLYDWLTAMNGASSSSASPSGVRGACPVGWHLPSNAEWWTLIDYVRAVVGGADGTKLKSSEYWTYDANTPAGTDDFGFSALPGGMYDSRGAEFYSNLGRWWTATENSPDWKYEWTIYDTRAEENTYPPADLNSVRCVQD
jgi:uncharacterized protein (TIGR02145 family)/uncharacterized repeat protein (TIGR02543 family)